MGRLKTISIFELQVWFEHVQTRIASMWQTWISDIFEMIDTFQARNELRRFEKCRVYLREYFKQS